MDFGRLGLIDDPATGRRRVAWARIIVLTYSRHSFVWPTFSQKLVDVIEGLEAAWAFFEGVPKYLVIDNFPAAVAGPDPLHPRLTRGFLEYSQRRGFTSDPAHQPSLCCLPTSRFLGVRLENVETGRHSK